MTTLSILLGITPEKPKDEMTPDSKHPLFATYLLPSFSLPYRPRQPSTTTAERTRHSSTSSNSSLPELSTSPTSTPGSSPPSATFIPPSFTAKASLEYALRGLSSATTSPYQSNRSPRLSRIHPNVLRCLNCSTDIAFTSQIVSKGFTGRHGRAYLVSPPAQSHELINTKIGRNVNRELLTGQHVVADVTCTICASVLGWKYVDAREPAQRYKIGKCILEMKRVVMGVGWEDAGGFVGDEEADENENKNVGGESEWVDEEEIVFDSEDEDECDDLFAGIWDRDVIRRRRGRRVGRRKVTVIPED